MFISGPVRAPLAPFFTVTSERCLMYASTNDLPGSYFRVADLIPSDDARPETRMRRFSCTYRMLSRGDNGR